ncbi:hypothetical protein ACB092_04G066400 [Castanea dentata]
MQLHYSYTAALCSSYYAGKTQLHGTTILAGNLILNMFDKKTEIYLDARPTYPSDLYSMAAVLIPHQSPLSSLGCWHWQWSSCYCSC